MCLSVNLCDKMHLLFAHTSKRKYLQICNFLQSLFPHDFVSLGLHTRGKDSLMAVKILILSSIFFHLDFIILQLLLSNGSCEKPYMQLFTGHFVESIKASLQKCSLLQSLTSLHAPFKHAKHILMLLFCNFDFLWAESLNTLCDVFEFMSVSLSTSNPE